MHPRGPLGRGTLTIGGALTLTRRLDWMRFLNMDPPIELYIQIGMWNPMNLAAAFRVEEISLTFRALNLLGLIGTARKEWTDVGTQGFPPRNTW